MRVVDRLARREATWRELDALVTRFEEAGKLRGRLRDAVGDVRRRRAADPGRIGAAEVVRLGELYRAACADLMLAEAHDLPRETVAYLHALVGRAHNALYRARGFRVADWAAEILDEVPRRLRRDPALRIAFALFFGTMLGAGLLAARSEGFAEKLVGAETIAMLEEMYAVPPSEGDREDALMAGFYINHNAAIGLKCYAYGLSFAILTVYELYSQALNLGAMFGYMLSSPYGKNFGEFVTAHAPFELTAIVLAGAAGMRLGWGLIDTRGLRRVDSLRRSALDSLPIAGTSVCLFVLAAFIEGFVSASRLPYAAKASVAAATALILVGYLALGGRSRPISPPGATAEPQPWPSTGP